jgi:hypothetical protein
VNLLISFPCNFFLVPLGHISVMGGVRRLFAFLMLKDYDYSPLHYRLMHAMVQPALETE